MTELIKCDGCETTIAPCNAGDWLQLSDIGTPSEVFHFCSFSCVATFAARQGPRTLEEYRERQRQMERPNES